jgi:SAM-dependent methyltransferase
VSAGRDAPVAAADSDPAVLWHEVECGGYAADLDLWDRLATHRGGSVLELGCGIGRVNLSLARAGHRIGGLDAEADLVAELERRARAETLRVDTWTADARRYSLGREFALILAPMQLAHLLGGAGGRRAMLACSARHLASGGQLALALLAGDAASAVGVPPPVPDVLERDEWVYSSLPIEARQVPAGIEVRRLRQTVSPQGELSEELDVTTLETLTPEMLEAEALEWGLRAAARHEIAPTPDHVGSTVVVLEAR